MDQPAALPPMILASRSPRRRELLAAAGYAFEVCPPDATAECGVCSNESPAAMVARLAYQKAADVSRRIGRGLVLACDTVVECDGQVLGKPADERHARQMLHTLSGRPHRVLSGLCLWPVPQGEPQVRVAVTTLSRPPVNALNEELIARFDAVLDEVTADEEISVLHIRSDQQAFCAGADLAWMRSCFATPEGPDGMVEVVRRMQRLFARLEAAPLVTLAEIGGAALGGGLELALACDVRVAALEAKLGLPEVRLGLVPSAGGTQRLARLCGRGIANRLILGGEVIDGALAERLGIVQWTQPREQLAEWTRELAVHFASSPRAALTANKRCIAAADDPARDGYAEELTETRRLYGHPETRRRVSEFLNRKGT